MPLLRFRAVDSKDICSISTKLIDELHALLGSPRDHFTLESVHTTFIKDGNVVEGSAVVEVGWFPREQDVQDKAAEIITNYIQSVGYDNVDVIFTQLDRHKYYENGKHFG